MYGLEFLVFERNSGQFLTYFANSASARREAGKMIPSNGILSVTLTSNFVKKGKWTWHAPSVAKCSTPFTNVPAIEKIKAEVEKFLKADTEGGREEVKDTAAKKRAR